MFPGMNHVQNIEMEIGQGRPHGRRHARGIRPLELEPEAPFPPHDQQIKLRASVRGPKEAFLGTGAEVCDRFLEDKPLPRGSQSRMRKEALPRLDLQQGVKQATVGEIDLRRFHLPLAQVLMPRRKLAHNEGCSQEIQVSANRRLTDPERACELRCVPDLAVGVRQHRPESAKRRRWDPDSQLGDIPFEECAHEASTPFGALAVASREKRSREPSPDPELFGTRGAHLGQVEPGEREELDATRQGLRRLPQKLRRGAPKEEKACRGTWPVGQYAEQWKKIRAPLDLIHDDKAVKAAEKQRGFLEASQVRRILEIEMGRGTLRPFIGDLFCQRRLPYLPRPEDGNDPVTGEQRNHMMSGGIPFNHARSIPCCLLYTSPSPRD